MSPKILFLDEETSAYKLDSSSFSFLVIYLTTCLPTVKKNQLSEFEN